MKQLSTGQDFRKLRIKKKSFRCYQMFTGRGRRKITPRMVTVSGVMPEGPGYNCLRVTLWTGSSKIRCDLLVRMLLFASRRILR